MTRKQLIIRLSCMYWIRLTLVIIISKTQQQPLSSRRKPVIMAFLDYVLFQCWPFTTSTHGEDRNKKSGPICKRNVHPLSGMA